MTQTNLEIAGSARFFSSLLGSIARDKSSGHAIRDGGSRGIERKIGILRNAEGHDIGPV
jgi:hypothetical protein